jgi:hypothetical protein
MPNTLMLFGVTSAVYDWLDASQELELENRDERLNLVS